MHTCTHMYTALDQFGGDSYVLHIYNIYPKLLFQRIPRRALDILYFFAYRAKSHKQAYLLTYLLHAAESFLRS